MDFRGSDHGFEVDFENLKCHSITVSSFSNEGNFHSIKPDIDINEELLKNIIILIHYHLRKCQQDDPHLVQMSKLESECK